MKSIINDIFSELSLSEVQEIEKGSLFITRFLLKLLLAICAAGFISLFGLSVLLERL